MRESSLAPPDTATHCFAEENCELRIRGISSRSPGREADVGHLERPNEG